MTTISSPQVSAVIARVVQEASAEKPADSLLRTQLKTAKLSREQSREVSKAVFAYYRWFGWLDKVRSITSSVRHALELDLEFREHPGSFTEATLEERALPTWVHGMMEIKPGWARSLQSQPRLWIRSRRGRRAELAAELGECVEAEKLLPGIVASEALCYEGLEDLFRTATFHSGQFELQDLSSQLVGLVCDPKAGQTWWDTCAGEGGKTLHLSELMDNKGLIWASDRAAWRLDLLKKRAGRSKCFNYRAAIWDGGERLPTKTRFDGVLVDAPCSGIGTWQRNPHARWTLTSKDIEELAEVQFRLLEHACSSVKPGGCLIYSVCTLSRLECGGVVDRFGEAHPEFELWPFELGVGGEPLGELTLAAPTIPANGMFIARWRRSV